jgi:CHASE2 domain-containing sensor protein
MLYVCLAVFMMVRAGSGSGLVAIALPFVWLALAARLWLGSAIAWAVAPQGGARLFVAAAAVGLLLSTFLMLILAGSNGGWADVWFPVMASVVAQVAAVARMARAQR